MQDHVRQVPEPAWLHPAGAEPAQPHTEVHIAKGPPGNSPAHAKPEPHHQQAGTSDTEPETGPAWLRHASTQAMGARGGTAEALPADTPGGTGPADALDPSGLTSLLARLDEFQGPEGAPGTPRRGPAPGAAEDWGDTAPGPAPEHSAAPDGAATGPGGACVSSCKHIAGASAASRTGPLAHGMAVTRGGSSGPAAAKPPAPRLASGAADLRERLELETLAHGQCAHLRPPTVLLVCLPACFQTTNLALCSAASKCSVTGHRVSPLACKACQELQEHLLRCQTVLHNFPLPQVPRPRACRAEGPARAAAGGAQRARPARGALPGAGPHPS